jgi:NAD(P)-dependent dehydrogenase (short-subunit alcohol dehydrogenase family)
VQNAPSQVTIVTGSNTGIGLETARRIAENGATVVLACRSMERGEAAKSDIEAHLAQCSSSSSSSSSGKSPFADSGKVLVRKLDLADLDSVKSFAVSFLDEFPRCEEDVKKCIHACMFCARARAAYALRDDLERAGGGAVLGTPPKAAVMPPNNFHSRSKQSNQIYIF